MERQYYIRDRLITVEEIENVRAAQVETDERGQALESSSAYGRSAAAALRDANAATETVEAFERANWYFTKPAAAMRGLMDSGEPVDNAPQTGKVVVRADGSIAVDTARLSVQLNSEYSEEECEAILDEKNLQIVNRLRFAPNLYEVQALARADAMEVSVELHDDERAWQRAGGGALLEQLLQEIRVHVPGARLAVDKDRLRATIADRVRTGRKGQCRAQHFVAGANAEDLERKMQGRRSGTEREGMRHSGAFANCPLELAQLRSRRGHPIGIEDPEHGLAVGGADIRRG